MDTNRISYPKTNTSYFKPTFCGYTRTKLGRCIDEFISSPSGSEDNPNKLIMLFYEFMNKKQKKKLGEGCRACVYKVDDKYVLKINKKIKEDSLFPTLGNEDIFGGVKAYFGSSVLSMNSGIKILKNVSSKGKHTPVGIQFNSTSTMPLLERTALWNSKYLPAFSKLPQKAFDDLAKSFAKLNEIEVDGYNYAFDTLNPNNFVLVGNSFRIVDEVDRTVKKAPNSIAGLLRVFLELMDVDNLAPKDFMNIDMRHSLLKKIILAGEKHELPLIADNNDLVTWQYVLDDTCDYRNLLEQLKRFRKAYPDMHTRLGKVKQLLDDEINYSYNTFY